MAITTKWTSGNFHLTAQGATYTKIFNCTWAEFQSGAGLPKIGGKLTGIIGGFGGWEDMRCTDIQAQPFAGGSDTKIEVYCTYSTTAKVVRAAKQDTPSAWEIEFDFASNQEPIRYWQKSTGTWVYWVDVWKENLVAELALDVVDRKGYDAPGLMKYTPQFSLRLRAFSSTLYLREVANSVGLINSGQLVSPLINLTDSEIDVDRSFGNDTYSWLLESCPVRRIRPNSWEYNFNFLMAGLTAENTYSTWFDHYNCPNVDIYLTYDFMSLLRQMSYGGNED